MTDDDAQDTPAEPTTSDTWAIIAGGGTAGHVLPGLAVARTLVERGHDAPTIHFVGAARGIEATLVPAAGFDITLLPGRGVQRRLAVENIGAVWGIVRALFSSVSLVRQRRPAVVLALGGFASVTCALAAVLWRVPLIVADQNARAGASNRLVARFAKACAVPFPETDLPRAVVTGNPVREEILEIADARDPAAARAELGLPVDRTVIVAFAGSLGSRRLNQALYGAVERWADRTDLAIHHVVGARDWDDRPTLEPAGLFYRAIRYEDRMDLVLAAADLAVCRSGGTTVAELAVMGVPAILVPLPIATRDHQTANAGPLVRVGGAVLVPDDAFDTDRLVREVEALLGGPDERSQAVDERSQAVDERSQTVDEHSTLLLMAEAARSLARPDAADRVADLIEDHARER